MPAPELRAGLIVLAPKRWYCVLVWRRRIASSSVSLVSSAMRRSAWAQVNGLAKQTARRMGHNGKLPVPGGPPFGPVTDQTAPVRARGAMAGRRVPFCQTCSGDGPVHADLTLRSDTFDLTRSGREGWCKVRRVIHDRGSLRCSSQNGAARWCGGAGAFSDDRLRTARLWRRREPCRPEAGPERAACTDVDENACVLSRGTDGRRRG